ncbi:Hint domain-containing protein [Shimia sp. R11_0]|uniref:Hint domain-containing protein n=1 Tax=Shimia sp. R11_0 TaxID=2821096 RepID=UPI001AD9CE4B|nr:Hint domain-containing protein [Shimia sp. R11_0]MBO9476232.1 Hint domain-containing protein [Shimia sp. R11_0]
MAQAYSGQTAAEATSQGIDIAGTGLSLVRRGAKIATRHGEKAVETLQIGDDLVSRDKGLMPLRWLGRLRADTPSVMVPAGALGRNVPVRNCYLSPEARIWMRGAEFDAVFGAHEVLVPVRDLIGWRGITEDQTGGDVGGDLHEYYLVLCDTPQILTVDGLQVDMRHVQDSIHLFETVQADDMARLFPELLALEARSDKWRRRLDRQEAARVVAVRNRA